MWSLVTFALPRVLSESEGFHLGLLFSGAGFISLVSNSPHHALSLFHKSLLAPSSPLPSLSVSAFPTFPEVSTGCLSPAYLLLICSSSHQALKFLTEAGAPEKAFLTFSHRVDALRTSLF